MTVTVLYVILAVVAIAAVLLVFVLASPLSVRIKYVDSLEVFAGLSFVKIKVFPKKEKKQKTKKEKKKKKSATVSEKGDKAAQARKSTTQDAEKKSSAKEKSSVKETLMLVYEIVKSVFETFGKRAEIDIDLLKVIISKPDAADTAVMFGLCGGIVSNILAFTSNFRKARIKDESVLVEPDFLTGKSSLGVDITLRIGTGALLFGLLKGYIKGISHK